MNTSKPFSNISDTIVISNKSGKSKSVAGLHLQVF